MGKIDKSNHSLWSDVTQIFLKEPRKCMQSMTARKVMVIKDSKGLYASC